MAFIPFIRRLQESYIYRYHLLACSVDTSHPSPMEPAQYHREQKIS